MTATDPQFEKGVLIVTNRLGEVVYGSPALSERTGFRHPEIIGGVPGRLWGGAMPKAFYRRMWETLTAGEIFSGVFENRKKNGATYLETMSLTPLLGRDGAVTHFLAVAPFHLALPEKERFDEEFPKVFHKKKQATENLMRWLHRWFGGTLETEKRGLSGIEETLLASTRALYQYREDDADLIRIAQADPDRFAPLYEKYFNMVHTYFLARLAPDRDLAFDLTQDVFTRAFLKLPTFHTENASFGTYLLRIAHNQLIDAYRKATRWDKWIVKDGRVLEEKEVSSVQSPDLSLLSTLDQSLMRLKYTEGYSIREIAGKLRLTENSVKLRLSRARKKLRSRL